MDSMIHTSELCEDLSHRIRAYKKEHSNLSGPQIAKRFNMSNSSLNRIENCDVKMPAIDQIIKILRGTGAKGDLLKYLDEHYPIIAETYREAYYSKTNEFIDIDLDFYLNDKDKFIIILLALTDSGTTREEISREFGQSGLGELNFLVEKNLLVEKEGVIGGNSDMLNVSPQTFKSLLANSTEKCFKIDKIKSGNNFLYYRAVRTNKEKVMKKIIRIMEDAEQEIKELLKDPSNYGNDDIFFGMVTDSLTSESSLINGGSKCLN